MDEPPRPKRRPKADGKRALRAAELRLFVRLYGRRAQKGRDPNDRHYDRDLEKWVKRLSPGGLDDLLRED